MNAQTTNTGHYADVNGLKLYYEIHGNGMPLVLLHGGGSTIETTYGRILPGLAAHHKVIAIELQAHGHTADIDRAMTFEQDADDVAALLQQLHITKADIMGFSNGATTCLQIAIRHPELVGKLILASALYRRDGMLPGFFEGMEHATLEQMPAPLADAYRRINPDPKGLQAMFNRDASRMVAFKDIPDAAVKSIQAPALVVSADKDVILPEHALLLSRTLPHAQLVILPGGHGDYIGEICAPDKASQLPAITTAIIENFLSKH
ncbi:alpha/beta hydrolase [Chitinophaga agri]|uniref:Alpha/beta hydrolase n=2 Tax=Chitinophaga agri TaxID=2703787 RepID=A0A6B9ZNC1_9BACT|nr:alpha/beta hydrolase [Chitinophaga agri]